MRKRQQSDIYPNFQTDKKLPFFLVPGDNASYATEADELIYWLADSKHLSGKVNVRMVVHDGTRNLYRSRWLQLDVSK
ncbi:MAG TPA: hypothetical protein VJ327_01955 [Patescibacteria group bacterium]|nr:hypothetical protein [Patescibacteria group bacterium]